jgi:alanyl-tRNA synthetase
MTSPGIRSSFLRFFEERGHRIVPSAPVIPHGDPTLLFTNAGMNQFKDVFLGTGRRDYVRAVDTQKCIRVSGKHNDLEEVGRDTYHHTFFEMLGNWSFGDYYKKEAIRWAWELLTETWGLDKKRLYATVFEADAEADQLWKTVTDIDHGHVMRFGKKDNFWEMGETGPCGPCSEVHFDMTPDLSGETLVNAGNPAVMEIWNLVFIQNNRNDRGELEELPAKHIDTGMGFERMCAVLQGKNSNYDTDVFVPIIRAIEETSGKQYSGEHNQVAMRVIADHVRMLSFAIADGAVPGNEGRGYVVRRILRRAARFGRNLDMHRPFLSRISPAVATAMGTAFPEIVQKQDHIQRVLRSEEESFNTTLDRGLEIFDSVVERIGHSTVFPGEDAFKLYDTFGFPLDLTELMAQERGLKVDVGVFSELMERQRERSRSISLSDVPGDKDSQKTSGPGETAAVPPAKKEAARQFRVSEVQTEFVGYDTLETETRIIAAREHLVVLASSPFYAEAGGQIGDSGILVSEDRIFRVLDTQKGQISNVLILDQPAEDSRHAAVQASVDRARRISIQRNHSATHLVHEALRRVLGNHVHQQGSLVASDRLRFDFPHLGRVTPEEIRAVEEIVNQKIADDISVFAEVDMPVEQARKIPNVKMFFGEKYGDTVRVVFIDENFSVEFCGGTHVHTTRDIGLFKIISESGIASGVRRIEAVTGDGVQRYIDERLAHLQRADDLILRLMEEKESFERELNRSDSKSLTARPSLGAVSLPPGQAESIKALEKTLAEREQAIEQIGRQTQDLKKELSRRRVKQAAVDIDILVAQATALNGVKVVSSRVQASDIEELKGMGDTLRAKLGSGVGVLASVIDEKVALVCVVTDDLIREKKLQAGAIISEMARHVGGRGGGRPHLATAGGKDTGKLDEALKQTTAIVRSMLPRLPS